MGSQHPILLQRVALIVTAMSCKAQIHKKEDFIGMRVAGKLAAQTLEFIEPRIAPGITTLEINDACHDFIVSNGGVPAPLNYKGFPKSVCTSVNNVVCHGIPSDGQTLHDGDIVNVDVTVIIDGWHGDTSKTFLVGDSFKQDSAKLRKIKKLVRVAEEAMMLGIEYVKPGVMLSGIGQTIQKRVMPEGFSIVRDYCGHGIGKVFHAYPNVVHYDIGANNAGDCKLEEGMFFTIEPMINIGSYETVLSNSDGWTVFTKDGSFSAQFEHTIGVTADGFEIFTKTE